MRFEISKDINGTVHFTEFDKTVSDYKGHGVTGEIKAASGCFCRSVTHGGIEWNKGSAIDYINVWISAKAIAAKQPPALLSKTWFFGSNDDAVNAKFEEMINDLEVETDLQRWKRESRSDDIEIKIKSIILLSEHYQKDQPKLHFRYLEKLSNSNSLLGLSRLAHCYETGFGTEENVTKSGEIYSKIDSKKLDLSFFYRKAKEYERKDSIKYNKFLQLGITSKCTDCINLREINRVKTKY